MVSIWGTLRQEVRLSPRVLGLPGKYRRLLNLHPKQIKNEEKKIKLTTWTPFEEPEAVHEE